MNEAMSAEAPKATYLDEYEPPAWEVESLELTFDIAIEKTLVTSRMQLAQRSTAVGSVPLVLDGRDLELLSVRANGIEIPPDAYDVDDERLVLSGFSSTAVVEIETAVYPEANKSGLGMLALNGHIVTECEAEGFRQMTYFPDRPDVLTVYTVKLIGSAEQFPVLLSNGDLIEKGPLPEGRHFTVWHDPFPKPSYIFAVMAGNWSKLAGSFTTCSGRQIELAIYADESLIDQCEFAMGALKRALKWEEDTFGFEYDLDVYNIIALTDHIGAMENKGLNLFAAHGIVADPAITTDDDYMLIERILAHEVFHNWTGNRVTCRDWFQLSVKEGLTRFRDQLFSQDMALSAYKRIDHVKALRRNQFPEDAGPAAHPVQPKSYFEIKNFYTTTVYEKGAEVVRMLYNLLGREQFIEGVKRYVAVNDLKAVTKEEFLAAMTEVSGMDLGQFCEWYDQAGRPLLKVTSDYDDQNKQFTLKFTQKNILENEANSAPYLVPVTVGLLNQEGDSIAGSRVLQVCKPEQSFVFENVASKPVPSMLRQFSAPVSLENNLSDEDLATLMGHDPDDFARWDAAQQLAVNIIRRLALRWRQGREIVLPAAYANAFVKTLQDEHTDRAVIAEILRVPDEPVLSDGLASIDLDAHVAARKFVIRQLGDIASEQLLARYEALYTQVSTGLDAQSIANRRLKNACLEHLVLLEQPDFLNLAVRQMKSADNMTDAFEALNALSQVDCQQRDEALDWFYHRWKDHPRVIDKWFLVQALTRTDDALDRVMALENHPDMDMNNAPRAWTFYGSFFRQNRVAFHDPSGRGYDFLVDRLLMMDAGKPGASMRFMPQILQWRRYDEHRQKLMKEALIRLSEGENISKGLYENVSRALSSL